MDADSEMPEFLESAASALSLAADHTRKVQSTKHRVFKENSSTLGNYGFQWMPCT